MHVVKTVTGEKHSVTIQPVVTRDYNQLDCNRYHFDWKAEQAYEVYKLMIVGETDILGLTSIQIIPEEWRFHIRLLSASKENTGEDKIYDRVAGNLIAYVAKIAVREFAELACVSLRPKTSIVRHYMQKYDMKRSGITLSLEMPEILEVINRYDHD